MTRPAQQRALPFEINSLPICERLLSPALHFSFARALGSVSWSDMLTHGSAWSQRLARCVEDALFDADHFISIHCGSDTSLSHPQGGGHVDPLTLLTFPFLQHPELFPSAPIPVKDVPMADITAIGQRYQQSLDSTENIFGAGEVRHFRDHFFPKCRGEPVFELGYALDAKVHIASTIMEQVTKQRLALCIPPESDLWKFFNYSFLRSFAVSLASTAAGTEGSLPTLSDLMAHGERLRAMLRSRRAIAEANILAILSERPFKADTYWLSTQFEPVCRMSCRVVASEHLFSAQLVFLNELLESVPDTTELMRLLGANFPAASPAAPRQRLSDASPAGGHCLASLTPALYQV